MKKLLAVVAIGAFAGSSAATAQVYSDRSTFEANASGLTIIDFNNTVGPGSANVQGASYSTAGVTFSDAQVALVDEDYASLLAGAEYGSDYIEWQNSDPQLLTITLIDPVTAVGFDFMEARGLTNQFTFVVDGQTFTATSGTSSSFFGYVSVNPFNTVTISAPYNGTFATMDNFTFNGGISSAVPEPATWAFMIVGFGAVGASMRSARRIKASTRATA